MQPFKVTNSLIALDNKRGEKHFCPLQLVIFHQLNTVDKELYLIVVIFFVFIYSVSSWNCW